MCDVNHIKKSVILRALLRDAYKGKAAGDKYKDFEIWCKKQKHLLNINLFVRSIRQASFDLFVASLEQLCQLLFALDHIHYS